MNRLAAWLHRRRHRAIVQVLALLALSTSVILSAGTSSPGRAIGSAIQVVVIGVALKLVLVSLQSAESTRSAHGSKMSAVDRSMSLLERERDRARSDIDALASRLGAAELRLHEQIDRTSQLSHLLETAVRRAEDRVAQHESALSARISAVTDRVDAFSTVALPDLEELAVLRVELAPALADLTAIHNQLLSMADQLDRVDRQLARLDGT